MCSSYRFIQSMVAAQSVDDLSYLFAKRPGVSRDEQKQHRWDICENNTLHQGVFPVSFQLSRDL